MAIDLVILTGQSNAGISITNQITENVNGTNINGTLYTLAALEASENLGLGYGGVLILAQVGANSSQPASIYGGTAFLPGAFNYTGPTWYNFVNNNPAQGVISSTYENQFAQWCRASYANLTGSGTVINHIALISMHDETDESNKSFENQTVLTDWEIAKYAQRNDVSNAFYKNSSSVPMSFFWVPGNISTPGGIGQNVQYGNAYNTESGGYNLYNSAYIPYFDMSNTTSISHNMPWLQILKMLCTSRETMAMPVCGGTG